MPPVMEKEYMLSKPPRIKVLQIIDSLRTGGKERQLVELLTGLSGYNEIESILLILTDNIHYNYLYEIGVPLYILKRKFKKDPFLYIKLYRLCRSIKPHIIHSWSSMCSIYTLPVAKISGIKFVNGFLRKVPSRLSPLHPDWIRAKLTFAFSDMIVSNSYAGLVAYNAPPSKSVCIHNGFNMNRINNFPDKQEIRFKFNIETDYVVGMVATFNEYKDYMTFIHSAVDILKQRNDVTFVAVGDGEILDEMIHLVPSEYKRQIKFLGRQNEVESIVNIFDIGVLLSRQEGEGISNSIMEYMALAKPVVATDCPGNRELVIDGITGLLVEKENHIRVSQAIVNLLNDRKMSEDLGINGKKRIVDDFNLLKMTQDFVSLYFHMI